MNNQLDKRVQELGFCCEWGFIHLVQPEALRGTRKFSAGATAAKYCVSEKTIFNARKRFDNGVSLCQGKETCIKHALKKGEKIDISVSYACTIKVADSGSHGREVWLVTFRDFPEIKASAAITVDKMELAKIELINAIEYRINKLQNVPFPSRAWEGDRLIDVPSHLVARMMDYKKFHMARKPSEFSR